MAESVGIDLHKKQSQICILSDSGEVLMEQQIKTDREQFEKMFSARGPCRIVI